MPARNRGYRLAALIALGDDPRLLLDGSSWHPVSWLRRADRSSISSFHLADLGRKLVERTFDLCLRSRSRIIDGEAVCCDNNGVPSFDRIRYRQHDGSVFLYAFDLIELDGDDMRREPFETRKTTLASFLRRAAPGLRLNEHIEADGPTVFAHACKLGLVARTSCAPSPSDCRTRYSGQGPHPANETEVSVSEGAARWRPFCVSRLDQMMAGPGRAGAPHLGGVIFWIPSSE